MLTYNDLKEKPKEFLAATSLTVEEFELVLPMFRRKYCELFTPGLTRKGKPRQRKEGGGIKEKLRTDEDKLLFILVYQKTYPLQTMHGLQFGLSQSQTNYWIHRLLPILRESLAELGMVPERDPQAVAKNPLVNESAPDLLIDGTERRRQRPKDAQKQAEYYSGKKKAHTDKNILLANTHSRKVVYLSPTEMGKKHDKKIADENAIAYPPGATLGKDIGFQGYDPKGVLTFQPKKSQKAKS
jgi:Helix-turn-helix of DDE superfamily endonuclease/DDE superfamily endonuclease